MGTRGWKARGAHVGPRVGAASEVVRSAWMQGGFGLAGGSDLGDVRKESAGTLRLLA